MVTKSSEVTAKYAMVAMRCPVVIAALLKTLTTNQLYQLLIETHNGVEFLSIASSSQTHLLDDVLASEQVYVTVDKRWDGAFIRMITKRNNSDGTRIPFWKVTILSVFLVVFVIPLNALLLPCVAAYPPLVAAMDAKFRPHEIWWVRMSLNLRLSWKSVLLLNVPRVTFYIYCTLQLLLVAAFSAMPLRPTPYTWQVAMLSWSGLAVLAESREALLQPKKWASDWLNLIELPALLITFAGALNLIVGGPDELSSTCRSVMACMLINTQGLRLLQITPRIGPLVLMLKSMMVDTLRHAFSCSTLPVPTCGKCADVTGIVSADATASSVCTAVGSPWWPSCWPASRSRSMKLSSTR